MKNRSKYDNKRPKEQNLFIVFHFVLQVREHKSAGFTVRRGHMTIAAGHSRSGAHKVIFKPQK